ncbi:hypothetical protein Taro_021632 [Colocasia esculenta]|uniref:Fucosyltransferase n=1 Tax=Colocasia esculenta TaxID=4460 RepID=A0A843V5K1_COLES|nr:hypothetical protein [Colocasia esculenta]
MANCKSPSFFVLQWLQKAGDSSPSPSSAAAAPAPSTTSQSLSELGIASPPDSAGKLPQAELFLDGAAAYTTTSSAATDSASEGPATIPPSPGSSDVAQDKLLGSLLAAGFDEESCRSRYQLASLYRRRTSPYKPSPNLIEGLRRYEALHERCGPYTGAYNMSLLRLKPAGGGRPIRSAMCKYLVWTPENGLGNRMVSLASAFLYALLAERVLLIDSSKDLGGLFCEPFPRSTWLLPREFPLKVSATFNQKHPQSYGNLLRTAGVAAALPPLLGTLPPSFVYAHLSHDYDSNDKRFFCGPDQHLLEKIPWMVLRSDQYFTPALFLVPAFRGRLGRMFPEKEAVFHHLGRYLFHPTNAVWGLITDYYEAHLARGSEMLGIQIRLHFRKEPALELVVRQILNCTWTHKLLPEVLGRRRRPLAAAATVNGSSGPSPSKAVLLTSLHAGFLERLEGVYGREQAAGVSFHQPSQEGRQRTGKEEHDAKALAEMYLLSTAEELVTSAWSTFGYVAQGLGGISPWILRGPVHTRVPEPACVRGASMEPCFHYPPNYDCATGDYMDTRKMLAPFTSKCGDRKGGLKLVGRKRKMTRSTSQR